MGYPDLDDDARDKDGYASYEICPSRDFQFGVPDDSDGVSYQEWREKWILEGMKWSNIAIIVPTDWRPMLNLLRVKSQK